MLGEAEFGYYGEFNIARHAIQESGCAEKIEFSGVNNDVVLEEFHFRVTTTSGRVVILWFDASNMDVAQVCYRPVGLSITDSRDDADHASSEESLPHRLYSIEGIAELLKNKTIKMTNLKDILCNLDELEQICRVNGNDKGAREGDPHCWDYLRLEFATDDGGYGYNDVRDKDVRDLR
jgi:hypothetical protein